MINILSVNVNPGGAISHYRGNGPLSELVHRYPMQFGVMPVERSDQVNPGDLRWCNVLFLLRPDCAEDLALVQMAKLLRRKVWVDFDDSYWDVQEYSPAKEYWKEHIRIFEQILAEADMVTVSCAALRERARSFNNNVHLLPNAHDDAVFPLSEVAAQSNNRTAVWRGSLHHQEDLYAYREALIHLVKRHSDWQFHFMGDKPIFLGKPLTDCENVVFHRQAPLLRYFENLTALRPAICLVPLVDIPFNHTKSAIAWLETTYAGASCLAPNLPNWQLPGITHYRDGTELVEGFEFLRWYVENGNTALRDRSWAAIQESLLLSQINHQRKVLLESL